MAKRVKQIIALDAETDPFLFGDAPEPFVWGAYDGEEFMHFWGSPKMIANRLCEQLKEYPHGTIVYAHNGGKFDFHFLLDKFDPDMMIINGRIAKATMFNGQIEFRDSLLIVPVPLSTFDKLEIDYEKFKKENRDKHRKEIIGYLKQDCVVLYDVVKHFIKRFGINLTVAGTALKELKKTGYVVPKTYDRYDSKFRQYYYGGRVETFKVGSFYATDKPLIYADINSAYSTAMMQDHWYGTEYFSSTVLPTDEKTLNRCLVCVEAIAKRCLPIKVKQKSSVYKTFYPNDDVPRIYNVTGWEIAAGLRTGTLEIKKVINCYQPLQSENFSNYIQKWFDEKAAAKGVSVMDYVFAKLMQNAAYGKFGQDGRRFSKFCIMPLGEWPEPIKDKEGNELPKDDPEQWQFHSDTETDLTFFKRADPSDTFFNVPVAASITGWVRAYLFEHIHNSKGVMYCDTDSIICEEFVGKVGAELGEWEIEAKLSEVHVAQRKMYACREWPHSDKGPVNKTKCAAKGVRLKFEEIKRGVETRGMVDYKFDAPSYSIKNGVRFVSRQTSFENIEKNIQNNPPIM